MLNRAHTTAPTLFPCLFRHVLIGEEASGDEGTRIAGDQDACGQVVELARAGYAKVNGTLDDEVGREVDGALQETLGDKRGREKCFLQKQQSCGLDVGRWTLDLR